MGKFLFRLRFLMQKRYGFDPLFFALMALDIILIILRKVFSRISPAISRGFTLVAFLVLIYALFRVVSGNIEGRSRENDAFLRLLGRAGSANITNPFENMGAGFSEVQRAESGKKHVKCPNCQSVLRVPRQRGKHTVRCPRCDHRFQIRIFFGKK